MQDVVDVAVIGGGAAGIAAARAVLETEGRSVLLLEAGHRLGGRARTVGDAFPMDLGCAWLHSGLTNVWTTIADATPGFTVDRTPAPWDDDARDLGLSEAERREHDAALVAFHARVEEEAARGNDGPLSSLLPPASRWRGLLDAVSTYVSGAELDRVSLLDTAHYRPGEGDDWRVVEGYGRLVATHGRSVPASLGTVVTSIDARAADVIRVETDRGTVTAKAAIVTVSTDVLAAGAIRFLPALPAKLDAAAHLPLGLADKLFLGVTRPELFPPEAYCMGSADTGRTAAYHMRPFGRPVIECFYGGQLARDLAGQGGGAALSFAKSEIAAQLGSDAAAAVAPLHVTDWSGEPHIRGSYAYARPGAAGMRARLAAPVDGRLFFAGEACSPERFTTAHGAYESGRAAAKAALAEMDQPRATPAERFN